MTRDGFDQHPVWEFVLDEETTEGQDEATVRPHEYTGVFDPEPVGMCVVKAEIILNDETSFPGYLYPPVSWLVSEIDEKVKAERIMGHIQPTAITQAGQISFWFGILKPGKSEIEEIYTKLGKDSARVFPVRYRSVVDMTSGTVEGTINGFMFLKGFFREIVKTIT